MHGEKTGRPALTSLMPQRISSGAVLEVSADGAATIAVTGHEMGQGIRSTVANYLAERLAFATLTCAPWRWVLVAPSPLAPEGFVDVGTGRTHPVVW